jgi:hypothetical protein
MAEVAVKSGQSRWESVKERSILIPRWGEVWNSCFYRVNHRGMRRNARICVFNYLVFGVECPFKCRVSRRPGGKTSRSPLDPLHWHKNADNPRLMHRCTSHISRARNATHKTIL